MDREEIKKLAELARLGVSDEQIDAYEKDFAQILSYIDLIKNAPVEDEEKSDEFLTKNTLREDDEVYTPGSFTEDLLHEAPEIEGNYIKVKKVL